MKIYDIHLIVDASVQFDTMPLALQSQLNSMFSEWPSFPALQTKQSNSQKIIHARVQTNNLTEAMLQGLFNVFSLNWVVLGIREARKTPATYDIDGIELTAEFYKIIKQIDKVTLLPFLNDIQDGEDINGEPIYRAPLIVDAVYLPMYAGTDPLLI